MSCVDPKTGDFVSRPKGKCPDGYIEKAKEAVRTRGVVFVDPRNK